ncbi:ubiquitin carboxyl-terminal hydrolase 24-like isoform X1 [Ruditapes philippinarum]|uniref:ubiquitin carboxyl-terminal hydrolase 24-like isoform X1 n=1 Tax=Ruditapes philippinarum TaxID=129788 RepID=UPI00295B95CB|nr:ubiquitin carboxyl-terminal hydrolase 24-like isoform X1 [Ruditapes philippinarum]
MDVDEDHVQTLLSMGFPSELDVRKALRAAKNSLNDAVAILTNDHPTQSFDTLDDIEMKDIAKSSTVPIYGPNLPPSYDDVETEKQLTEAMDDTGGAEGGQEEANPYEFPVTNLYELEGRVFAEHWSIPYKKDESLGKCLVAAANLAEAGLMDNDDNCSRFVNRVMTDSFQKLMNSNAVHRWNTEIQEGINNMLQLLIDLVAARLTHQPVHLHLMDILGMAFNPETEFHYKNKSRRDRTAWEEKFEGGVPFSKVENSNFKDPYGWLTCLINRFAMKGGFDHIKKILESEELDAPAIAALLKPLGVCAEFLDKEIMKSLLTNGMELSIKYVQNLAEKDFKEKKVGSVSDLLASMKLLCMNIWPNDVEALDDLRLDIALRMLKSPHFNAKMNSLKEVTKLIEDSTSAKNPRQKTAIPANKIQEWLVENKVLSIALEGNIDQAQYCDKIKGIVDFLGTDLSSDELTMIWKMQLSQTNNVIDNIHSIIAAAAVKFDPNQLEHLLLLIQKKWQEENDKSREKLLSLIGKIGRDAKIPKTTNQVLQLLWDLSHLPALSTHLIELALEEHLAILNDSYIVKDQVKRSYVSKCVDDIKKGVCVLPTLKQLHQLSKNILKHSFKQDKGILHELNKNFDIIKLVTQSLVKCHKQAASSDGQLDQNTLVDSRYPHSEYVMSHLSFLQYVLQEGVLYLPWNRAREIWSALVASSEACTWDRETCYEWFSKGLMDLDNETQTKLFQNELLRLDPAKISDKGFVCFKTYFENVNKNDHRLKDSSGSLIVEKTDLMGLDFLWELCLNTPDETIADSAIQLLLNMSYTNLASRMKKDPVNLHKKFINECQTRLETAMIGVSGTAISQAILSATKTLTAAVVPEVANISVPSKSIKLLNIERLLWIAEMYVLNVEETHVSPRTILPHGASFQGFQINLFISCETPKQEFMLVCHSNETLGNVKVKIANRLRQSTENIQVVAQEKLVSNVLGSNKDQKLLHQLDFEDNQTIQVRMVTPSSTASTSQSKEAPGTPLSKQTFDLEQEKMLPGVIMAAGGQVFDMLYQLSELEETKITTRVRKLLMLIPTDPAVIDALDSVSTRLPTLGSSDDLSPRSSPRKSTTAPSPKQTPQETLKALFDCSSPDMSAFRVLYNLEVLSSKLMPTSQDMGSKVSSQAFFEDFLTAGGLSTVVNVLQPESLHQDINYVTRQGCYSVCLQLARYLLCGQTVTGDLAFTPAKEDNRLSSAGSAGATVVPVTPPVGTPVITLSPLTVDTRTAGSHAVQTMGVHDFTETVSCFMRVAWAAAAGKLHLLSSPQPIRESATAYSCGRRSRQSSTGSQGSTGSESDCQSLHGGVCVKQNFISTKDCNIAKEALEILVTCLQLRSELIAAFYTLPCVSDFIIDILVGCSQSDIRSAAADQFYQLGQTEVTNLESSSNPQTPHQFLLQVLLKAYLPFWVSSSSTRGASQRLLSQCSQYFDLRCKLLENLSTVDQKQYQVDISGMLEDEVAWLSNFVPTEHPDLMDTDNMLLAGHLKLIKTLFTCEGICKEEYGKALVHDLLHDFLFPASKTMMDSMNGGTTDLLLSELNPKCNKTESRVAAYELITELANESLSNLTDVCSQLIEMHHQPNLDCANEWEYLPPVDGRAVCGYVGLRNGGATCYMNSVIQQLFMVPGIPDAVLSTDDEDTDEESVYYQIQQVFGNLMDSRLQYHEPEKFWKVFKLWGDPVNIREQQDAFDFFQALIDQIDEQLKKSGKEEIFKKKFQGIFTDQKICKDCPHRYEREETFTALNLTVKNATLQDSLDQFVKGELLEGDNAYYCEKCGEKRNTIKRMHIKSLPPTLCIHLKRFGYDWEANRALKFDDYFKFPWVLDMEPYTAEGMARRDAETNKETEEPEQQVIDSRSGETPPMEITLSVTPENKQINYELVGVVVHSGQANAGHYYSFIKERRGTVLNNSNKGKWFKFNDTIVEEFEMGDAAVEAECFGGTYKAKVYEQSNSYPEDRLRYWNGYMLFYERMEESMTPLSAKKTKIVTRKLWPDGVPRGSSQRDSFVELTELVHKGERKGMFMDKMPASIQRFIHSENLTFIKNRDVFNEEYFRFVKNLVAENSNHMKHEDYSNMCMVGLRLAVKFLFNTYFRTKKKTKAELDEWVDVIEVILSRCKEACFWMVEYIASEEGSSYIRPFLLESPNMDVRLSFAKILERLLCSFLSEHGGLPTHKCLDEILEYLLQMLNKEVIDHCKHSVQYFLVLKCYVQMGTKACIHLFKLNGFKRLAVFLLGNSSLSSSSSSSAESESHSRRWSSIQSREFAHLHTILATLILNCDVKAYWTIKPGDFKVKKPLTVTPQTFLKMSADMEKYTYGPEATRYLREVVTAIREVGVILKSVEDMLLYCSFCNEKFSTTLLKQLMMQYMNAPSNELKPIFSILTDLLLLEDPLQLKRLQLVIDGHVDDHGQQFEGLLAVIRLNHVQDSRRSYWCIKFLVNLVNKCPLVKDDLQQTKSKWQWAVNWLKKKMSEYSYWSSSGTAASNEDSNRKSFQRTISAQDTLEEATALLTELENYADMDTNGNSVASPTESDTMTSGDASPRNQPTDNQSDSHMSTGNQSDTNMSTIEEDKGEKSSKDTSNS